MTVVQDVSGLSRLVSQVLRHEPWLFELELDQDGWVSVESVLPALRQQQSEWANLSESDLAYMIEVSAKRRHEMRDGRIRALYGHSTPSRINRTPVSPATVLFHGTAPEIVPLIMTSGLMPMGRQYVHLSADIPTALEVGRRKAKKPIILRVLSATAASEGVRFYEGNEKVWLADHVPPQFIMFEETH